MYQKVLAKPPRAHWVDMKHEEKTRLPGLSPLSLYIPGLREVRMPEPGAFPLEDCSFLPLSPVSHSFPITKVCQEMTVPPQPQPLLSPTIPALPLSLPFPLFLVHKVPVSTVAQLGHCLPWLTASISWLTMSGSLSPGHLGFLCSAPPV